MYYKIWIQIEAHPERANEDCEPYNADEPVDICVCSTLRRANKIVAEISDKYCDEGAK